MKIELRKQSPEQASVLFVALIATAIIGTTLYTYLTLLQNQNLTVVRSQAWNGSLALAEAGVEEAMAQMNPGANVGNLILTANGWGQPTNGLYGPITRTLPSGTYAVSFTTNSNPIIYCSGSMTLPFMSATISRTIKVATSNSPLFNVSFAAVNAVTMNGNGIASDSFDSSNTNLSTNGQYDSSKTSTNGSVGSVNGPVSLSNHTIDGNLYLGPNATFSSSSNQVAGTVYNDFNVGYPDVVLPSVTWLPAPSTPQVIGGTSYTHVFLTSGYYTVTDSSSIYVGTNVSATIAVTAASWNPGAVNIVGAAYANSGTLTVYMEGTSASMAGNTSVNSGVASNFIFYGMPSCTSITFSGNSSFVGCVYAPEASLTLNGGGNNNGFIGSCIVNNITMNGHYDFHFDQALENGPSRGYTVYSWQEL